MRHLPPYRTVAIAASVELALAVVGLALGTVAGVAPMSSLSWSVRDVAIGVVATLPLLTIFHFTWRSRAAPLRRIRDDLERLLPEMFAGASPSGLALVSLAAGIGEEVLFRGFAQGWLQVLLGSTPGLLAASVVFGVAHPLSAGYVVIASLMGAYLGVLWQLTGNLLVPIVTHALYDLLVLRVLLPASRQGDRSP